MTKSEELNYLAAKYPGVSPIAILKVSLAVKGAVLSENALLRIQKEDLRFTKGDPYGLAFDIQKENFYLPGPVIFRDGTSLFVNYGEPYEDPYIFDYDKEAGVFLVMDGERAVDSIDFTPRPAFFDGVTSKGTKMDAVGGTGSPQRLLFNAYQRCRLWEEGLQCHYCALFTSNSYIREVDPEDAYETLSEALKEPGRFSEISVSGGMDPEGKEAFSVETERYIRFLKALSRDMAGHFDLELLAPAYKKKDLKRIYDETGIGSYRANIEIWDEKTFKIMCPGKEKYVGYGTWLARLCDAVDIFGKGNVYSTIVCGAELAKPQGLKSQEEAFDSNMEFCEFMAKNGIYPHAAIWRPHRHEHLGWQSMQDVEYYIRIAEGFNNIRKSSFGISCGRCARGGDCVDFDITRADRAEKINIKNSKAAYCTDRSEYAAKNIPDKILKILSDPGAETYVEINEKEEGPVYIKTEKPFVINGRLLIMPLISDRDFLSAYLIKKIWFKQPVFLVIKCSGRAVRLKARAFRFHIVGGIFGEALLKIREKKPGADMASALEFHFINIENKSFGGVLPPAENEGTKAQLHLDRQLKKAVCDQPVR